MCCCSEKVPSLKVFKALPVEAVHPKFTTMFCTGDVMAASCNSTKPVPQDCDASMGQLKCEPALLRSLSNRIDLTCWVVGANIPNPEVYVGTWLDNQLQELDNRVSNATPAGVRNYPAGCADGNLDKVCTCSQY